MDHTPDESLLELEQVEKETDTADVTPAEVSAVHTDTEAAREASGEIGEAVTAELEAEAKLVDVAIEKKHKNRESTSEKSKKAGTERKAKSGKAEPVAAKLLDPLRLRGKKYRAKVALVDRTKSYPIEEAVALVKETAYGTFDGSVELHVKVKADTVRGMITLPHGTGKTKKVAVADDATLEAIAAGKLEFDVLLATPAQMPKLAKYAKVLGPKGLMPSPKAGTVTDDIEKATAEIGGGRMEYRADKNGVVHTTIGRVSFDADKLVENYKALEQVLISSKMLSISISATQGPGVKVEIAK